MTAKKSETILLLKDMLKSIASGSWRAESKIEKLFE